jgi:hypothetical protein
VGPRPGNRRGRLVPGRFPPPYFLASRALNLDVPPATGPPPSLTADRLAVQFAGAVTGHAPAHIQPPRCARTVDTYRSTRLPWRALFAQIDRSAPSAGTFMFLFIITIPFGFASFRLAPLCSGRSAARLLSCPTAGVPSRIADCCPLLYGLALLAMVQWRPFQVSMRVRETALVLV